MTDTAPANTASMYVVVEMFVGTATAAGAMVVDAISITESATVLPYGDGDTPGWQWDGTPHASTSSRVVSLTAADTRARLDELETRLKGAGLLL